MTPFLFSISWTRSGTTHKGLLPRHTVHISNESVKTKKEKLVGNEMDTFFETDLWLEGEWPGLGLSIKYKMTVCRVE